MYREPAFTAARRRRRFGFLERSRAPHTKCDAKECDATRRDAEYSPRLLPHYSFRSQRPPTDSDSNTDSTRRIGYRYYNYTILYYTLVPYSKRLRIRVHLSIRCARVPIENTTTVHASCSYSTFEVAVEFEYSTVTVYRGDESLAVRAAVSGRIRTTSHLHRIPFHCEQSTIPSHFASRVSRSRRRAVQISAAGNQELTSSPHIHTIRTDPFITSHSTTTLH